MCQQLIDHLRAGFPCYWINTSEADRVKTSVQEAIENFEFKDGSKAQVTSWNCLDSAGPMPGLQPLNELTSTQGRAVKFLYNFHWFIDKPPVIQTIQDSFSVWANEGKAIVVVAPVEKIPAELKNDFTMIELKLPDSEEIQEIIEHSSPAKEFMPKGKDLKQIVNASKGLPKRELQNVYNLSLVKEKRFDIKVINDYRSQAIKNSGLATVLEPTVKPEDIIGYDIPRDFVMSTIHNPNAKGVLFIGPPGCGKTMLVKSFAYASKKLTLMINTGQLFSKYHGETDKNVKALIDLAWSLGDSYFVFDEMEKQFAGVGGSSSMDSGVTSRAIGQFLEFFQNRPPGCYIGGTCNTFRGLPPEYLRAGRWDTAPIYIGLPNEKVRKKIMNHYIDKFQLTPNQCKVIPKTDHWSGSEIETLCHNAEMRGSTLIEASKFVLPLYTTMKEEIVGLEKWSEGRTIKSDDMIGEKVKLKKRRIDV
jgi:SpoVK/Ycf46/Vps4 family AAA+-type ATPase